MSQTPDETVSDSAPSSGRFILWCLLLATMIAAAFYNYTLIADPMAEMVGSRAQTFGVGTGSVAAGIIVVLEIFAGLFFLECRGTTTMFSEIQKLAATLRARLKYVFIFQLFMFASIGAGLVLMRDLLAAQEDIAPGYDLAGPMPLAAQMIVAFVLPFVLILAPLAADRVVRALRGQRV